MVTRASKLWALLPAVWAGSVAGCREVPATQLLVVVDSDLVVDRELNRITVTVTDPSGQHRHEQRDFALRPTARPASYALPLSFGVVPIEGDAARRVRVIVTARTADTGREIELTALAGFQPDRKLLLTMFLERSCVGVVDRCGPAETCRGGQCVSAERTSLPDITDQANVNASGLFDVARTDATLDAPASTDAGPEPDKPDVVDASVPLDRPDVVDASTTVDRPDAVDAPDVAPALPTAQLVYPTAGALTNTRVIGFEAHATGVPAGVSASLEISPQSSFPALETVTVAIPTSTTTGTVTTWTVPSVNADELVAPGGPIGSRRVLWWRLKLVQATSLSSRSVAWPFRLRPTQAGRTVNALVRARAVGQAGDFDGNGASDLLVVTARSGVTAGATLVLGRAFSHTVEHTVLVSRPALDFGRAARLGDVNADGLEDFGVAGGFPGGSGESGGAYLVLGTTETSDRSPTLVPGTAGATTDPLRMAPVMDADRDGVGEFVVGFPATGVLRVYRGLSGARDGRFVELLPAVAGADPAMSLATAGDVNGDGRGDFVVGHGARGDADLYLAADVGGVGTFQRVSLPASGLANTVNYGASVAGGGDLNGDGFSDVVVAGDAGLRVFYGGVAGFASTGTFVDPSPCAAGAERRVANLGDLNGDGGDEVGLAYVGACMHVLRAPLGPAAGAPALAIQRTLTAPGGDTTWASTLAAAGDFDDDGFADFAVGVPHLTDPLRSTMKVYFGDASLWSAGAGDAGAPLVMVVTPNSAGWGYSVASLGWGAPRGPSPRAPWPRG